MEPWLVAVQAVAAAVSAATAIYLVRVTIARDRELRSERNLDRAHDQLRGLVEGLRAVRESFGSDLDTDFEVARARLATALAISPNILPSCEAVLDDGMPKPPYVMGAMEHWNRLDAALSEVRHVALVMSTGYGWKAPARKRWRLG